MEKQIQALMKLGLSREEALQTLADDADIEKGKPKDFDLTAEQMKNAKQYTKVGTRKTSTTPTKRERKANPTKALIIAELFKFLGENAEISAEPSHRRENLKIHKNPRKNGDFFVIFHKKRSFLPICAICLLTFGVSLTNVAAQI